jgi:hypothetical protein
MTPRQIRIACCGMVVSTREYRLSDDLDALSRDVLEDVQYLLWYLEKPVSVWWVEGDYTMACGRYR